MALEALFPVCPNAEVVGVLPPCAPNTEEAPKPDEAEFCGPFCAAPRIDRPPPAAGLSAAVLSVGLLVFVPKPLNPVVPGAVAAAPKLKVDLVVEASGFGAVLPKPEVADVPNPPVGAPPKRTPLGWVFAVEPKSPLLVDGCKGVAPGLLLASSAAVLGWVEPNMLVGALVVGAAEVVEVA